MKHVALFALLALLVATAIPTQAQDMPVRKGNWMIDGSLGFSSSGGDLYENADGDGTTTITIAPEAMYFLMDQLGVGLVLNYSSTSQGDESSSDLSIGPRVAYFFKTGDPKFYPFLGAGVFFGSHSHDNGVDGAGHSEYTNSMTTIAVSGGVMYMVNTHVGLSAFLNYEMVSLKYDEDLKYQDDTRDGNIFSIMVGFNWFLK